MKLVTPQEPWDADEEIAALIERLHETGRRLEHLTGGEVDSVANSSGQSFLLHHAQNQLHIEAASRQEAILNALPVSIAMLNNQGTIVSVNEEWRDFSRANAADTRGDSIGLNYLAVCDAARGENALEASEVAAGIRSVLDGTVPMFTIEYPCHSPVQRRWFLMAVTPLGEDASKGVVVMHMDITERKVYEAKVTHLNRVYAMLSGINSLIVHVNDREALFTEACRIAVEEGGFRMAMLAILDKETGKIVPAASAGKHKQLLKAIHKKLQSTNKVANTMVARAISTGEIIIANDSLHDPQVLLGELYKGMEVRSIVVLPLLVADEAVGAIALYMSEANFFQEEEMQLLAELADDVAFAIDHLENQERLNYLAFYDELTGLANRNLFLERATQYVNGAASGKHKLAICLMDLERFKNINDSFGRPIGDELLKQVGQWLTLHAGDASLLARIEADCFAIVIPKLREEGNLAKFADKLIKFFVDQQFILADSMFRVGAQVGVAIFPDDGRDTDVLFSNAEAALKNAKASGERFLFYKPEMNAAVASKLAMENHLRQAIDNEEFVLHYQPKFNLARDTVTGAEALIRWNDPRTGLVPPGKFIPILEETGLIYQVGRWALHKAIEDNKRWRAAGLPPVRIAVNVSPLQLRNSNFTDEIRQAVAADHRATEGLELEITESLIMENVGLSISTLQAIRDLGVTIAIDDFGTGFSSLSHLSKLPVDVLKIDGSFIVDMTAGPEGLALVSTIISLAHALRLRVIAEGVETQEQWNLLKLLGCDDIQGFFFSKPVPAAVFEAKFLVAPTTTP